MGKVQLIWRKGMLQEGVNLKRAVRISARWVIIGIFSRWWFGLAVEASLDLGLGHARSVLKKPQFL